MPARSDLQRVLRERFGHAEFRPGQQRLVEDVLAGRDALAVLPTGSGKSLVYQLASQLLPHLTLVVSPLLALMRDQLESLEAHGVAASSVSSQLTDAEADAQLRAAQAGQTRLLYVTPERLDDPRFTSLKVSLLVIDEAHSISEWGHSFRPAYLGLATAAERMGRPPVLALTATASPFIRREVTERLRLHDPDVVVNGTDRPNLFFEVIRVEDEREDKRVLHDLLSDSEDAGSVIVYTATTRAAEDTANWLREWGISADAYHGRRKKADRERVQTAFMDGRLRAIAATNAFGMGIDKPDVRMVIHRDVPSSLEAYYQEAGRAGRDGEPSRCVLIYRPGDLGRAAFLNGGGELTREEVRHARRGLLEQRQGTLAEMQHAAGLNRGDFLRLLDLLIETGLAVNKRGRVSLTADDFDANAIPLEREQARRAYEKSRLEMMRAYAETRTCRRRFILNYFGEDFAYERCGRCDNDRDSPELARAADGPFRAQQRVRHAHWGEGEVSHLNADTLTVLFDAAGYKTLALDLVLADALLESVE